MKNKRMPLVDKLLLYKCGFIESVNDQLKKHQEIEHTRHRSVWNVVANILGALTAYTLKPQKPHFAFECCSSGFLTSALIPSRRIFGAIQRILSSVLVRC